MTLMRVVVNVATVISAALGLALAGDPITLPGTQYSMSLPGSPECGAEADAVKLPIPIDIPVSCSVVVDGLRYTFDYWVLPGQVPNDQAEGAMFAAALGHAMAMGGDIVDKQVGTVAGFPSMDFTIVAKKRKPIGYGRYVIVRTHLVRAMVEATGDRITRESVDDVLKSLKIE
jgi:hypothetical protein